MVAAVHYFGTEADHRALLDYLGEPQSVSLHPWPIVTPTAAALTRDEALLHSHVAIASSILGPPVLIRPGAAGMEPRGRSGLFNKLNWERFRPSASESLIDSNVSPVLLWTPGSAESGSIQVSAIGTQADTMADISDEYARWVKRVMSWVRRSGTKVWGLETNTIRPDLDIRLSTVSAVFALPDALASMEAGSIGDGV